MRQDVKRQTIYNQKSTQPSPHCQLRGLQPSCRKPSKKNTVQDPSKTPQDPPDPPKILSIVIRVIVIVITIIIVIIVIVIIIITIITVIIVMVKIITIIIVIIVIVMSTGWKRFSGAVVLHATTVIASSLASSQPSMRWEAQKCPCGQGHVTSTCRHNCLIHTFFQRIKLLVQLLPSMTGA